MKANDITRDRARIVCTRCHDRKVRCDLQEQPGGRCRNCQRDGKECRRRFGPRTKVPPDARSTPRQSGPPALLPLNSSDEPHPRSVHSEGPSPAFTTASYPERIKAPQTPNQRPGYFGDQSLLSYPSDSEPPYTPQPEGLSVDATDAILRLTRATTVPPKPLAKALVDFYFDELYHIIPVIDREDINVPEPSLLLRHSLYFAGSLMRRTTSSLASLSPEECYAKLKTLLFLNFEKDKINILKTLCLLGSWSSNSPQVVTLDSPWHWAGMAIRLALQIGLHRESSYERKPEGVSGRRIWWSLFNNDILQSMCYGRPSMIHKQDYDVQLPTLKDFPDLDRGADLFIALTRLCVELGNISSLMNLHQETTYEEISPILISLQTWITQLPADLRLCDQNGDRKQYSRRVLELHVVYFITIILLYLLPGPHRSSQHLCTASIVASSCASRLYEDILCHEDTSYLLPIHGWFNLVAAVPQVYCTAKFAGYEAICSEELDILCSVLVQMCEKYPSANLVLAQIRRFSRDGRLPGVAGTGDNEKAINNLAQPTHPDNSYTHMGALFPFPSNICPKMDLLHVNRVVSNVNNTVFSPFNMGDMHWTFDWSSTSMEDFSNFGNMFPSDPSML